MRHPFLIAASFLALAACGESADPDNALAEANATGAEASQAVANAVEQSPAAPLDKEQALALMEERHENYERIGDAMKAVTRELRSDSPDLAAVREQAAFIAGIAPEVKTWFPEGTGPEAGKTEAKAAIWENKEDFLTKAAAFERSATAFKQAADGGDLEAIRAAQADLGKSCKACHDLYREEH